MDGIGNGIAVAVKALQDDLDLVDILWCAALEAARLYGVVDVSVRRHGGQAQVVPKRTPWTATSSTRSSIAVRRSTGVSSGAFTLSASCFTSIFSWLSSASRAATLQCNDG
jgi:hypothetical protein